MRCNSKANWRTILRGCLYGGFLQFQEGAIGKNKSSVESQGTSVELQEALIQYTGEPAGSSDGMRSGYCYHKTGCSPLSFLFSVQRQCFYSKLPNFMQKNLIFVF